VAEHVSVGVSMEERPISVEKSVEKKDEDDCGQGEEG